MAEEPETTSPKLPAEHTARQLQVPAFSGFQSYPNGDLQMYPFMYPALIPGFNPVQNQDQMNQGAGIYAFPVLPFTGHVPGFPPINPIPLTYNIPTRRNPEAGNTDEVHGRVEEHQRQQHAAQRQIRRFQIAFQIDLFLILKLAVMVFMFSQDGSRQRLAVLVLFASLVYLYQTGALTPLVQWLSQGMQRAAAPPLPPRHPAGANNNPAAARQGDQNAALGEAEVRAVNENENENENGPVGNGNHPGENDNMAGPPEGNDRNQWWGIVKEIQILVLGFITSLLPGFQNVD